VPAKPGEKPCPGHDRKKEKKRPGSKEKICFHRSSEKKEGTALRFVRGKRTRGGRRDGKEKREGDFFCERRKKRGGRETSPRPRLNSVLPKVLQGRKRFFVMEKKKVGVVNKTARKGLFLRREKKKTTMELCQRDRRGEGGNAPGQKEEVHGCEKRFRCECAGGGKGFAIGV